MSWMINKRTNTRIISVLFAVALWLYVASGENPVEYKPVKDIPVQVLNVDAVNMSGLVIKDPKQYKIDVTLQGKRSILNEIKPGVIIAEADLRGHTQRGTNNVPIEVKGLPTNVELVDFSPKSIKVDMEQVSSVQVPVTVSTEGRPMEGYTTLMPVITPGEVLVNGAESLLTNLKVVTAVMKLAGASEDIKEVLAVRAVDAEGKNVAGVMLSPNIVEVTVPVKKTKQVTVEPVIAGQPFSGWEITNINLNRTTVIIYGEKSVLQEIDSIQTERVSIAGMDKDSSINVRLIIPEGVETVDNVDTVTVHIRGEKLMNKEIAAEKVNITDLREDLMITEETIIPVVKVTVRGRESVINEITTDSVSVSAGLGGLEAGKHNISLKAELPDNVELVDMEPSRIRIELTAKEEDGE